MTKRKIEYWVIPPEQDAEFVACMEEVLETYAKAYDPEHPVLCMDEQPVQLLKETRVPIEATRSTASVSITNTNATARPAFSCSPSHSQASGKRPLARGEPKPTGQSKSLTCWTRAMQIARV